MTREDLLSRITSVMLTGGSNDYTAETTRDGIWYDGELAMKLFFGHIIGALISTADFNKAMDKERVHIKASKAHDLIKQMAKRLSAIMIELKPVPGTNLSIIVTGMIVQDSPLETYVFNLTDDGHCYVTTLQPYLSITPDQ